MNKTVTYAFLTPLSQREKKNNMEKEQMLASKYQSHNWEYGSCNSCHLFSTVHFCPALLKTILIVEIYSAEKQTELAAYQINTKSVPLNLSNQVKFLVIVHHVFKLCYIPFVFFLTYFYCICFILMCEIHTSCSQPIGLMEQLIQLILYNNQIFQAISVNQISISAK